MTLLSLLTLGGLFGTSTKRNIGDIVATFTQARTDLQVAIEEQQTAIDKAEVDKVNADKEADFALALATKEAKAIADKALAKAEKTIAAAKKKAKAKQTEALEHQIATVEDCLNTVKDAKASIKLANQWIDKIPSID